jgi:hypothetical protein
MKERGAIFLFCPGHHTKVIYYYKAEEFVCLHALISGINGLI